MRDNEIRYSRLLKHIVDYLNENNDKVYGIIEFNQPYDISFENENIPYNGYKLYGVICSNEFINNNTFDMVKQFERNKNIDTCKEYLLTNNIIYCYYGNKGYNNTIYKNCNPKDYINLDESYNYFRCIDEELLNSVISNIKEKQSSRLTKKLFKRYY